MATSLADSSTDRAPELTQGEGEGAGDGPYSPAMDDPFFSDAGEPAAPQSPRYLSFDTQLLSLDAASPSQAKRALEAHLEETERRLQEASRIGTALIQQQKELEDRLREVERQQDEEEIGPELRRKLIDLEKEYNEIGRESARAFLAPKRLVSSEEGCPGTPSFDPKVRPLFTAGDPLLTMLTTCPVTYQPGVLQP
ncbi:hypothetical protein M432DRAFT_297567 [Thermoascus aurantiacus ATCC 26904]